MADNKNVVIAGGYSFMSADDAVLADTERKKVAYLKAHMDMNNMEVVKNLYEKAIREQFFKTPVGLDFLKQLQNQLAHDPSIDLDELLPIPVTQIYSQNGPKEYKKVERRVPAPSKQKEKVKPLFVSVVLNIALIIAVIIMFVIALNSENPNIINYETNLVNKYSAWEEELTQREIAVGERERALLK